MAFSRICGLNFGFKYNFRQREPEKIWNFPLLKNKRITLNLHKIVIWFLKQLMMSSIKEIITLSFNVVDKC